MGGQPVLISRTGWTAELGIDEMCRDLWTWQSANPMGFVDGSAEL